MATYNKNALLLFCVMSIILINIIGCEGNQKLTGRTFYYENQKSCTLIHCSSIKPCCNNCESNMFLITNLDTIQLYGTRIYSGVRSRWKIIKNDTVFTAETLSSKKKNQPLVFSGKECEILTNDKFEVGKTYEVKGGFLSPSKGSIKKAFNVVGCKMVR